MAKLNLRLVLGLESGNLQKGMRKVQSQVASFMRNLNSYAAALGAGFGIASFIQKLKDSAIDLSTANAVLKNTMLNNETNMAEYGNTMIWLQNISKKYSQDIVGLTESFAKFHAAADGMTDANGKLTVSLQQQRDIFEAMTQAALFYHLSSEKTHDAMVALEQMMSKGAVTAEELRRQLGNNLPGAFALMAKAAQDAGLSTNGTTAELEALMKQGKVAADQVLPHFAKRLKEATAGFDDKTIQAAMSRLKNAFTELTKNLGVENTIYKWTENLTKAIEYVARNTKEVFTSIATVIGDILFLKIVKSIGAAVAGTAVYKREMKAARIEAQKNAEALFRAEAATRGLAVGTAQYKRELKAARIEAEKNIPTGKVLVAYGKGLLDILKGIAKRTIWAAIILSVSEVVTHFIQLNQKTKETNTLFGQLKKNMNEGLGRLDSASVKNDLELTLKTIKNAGRDTKVFANGLEEINEKLGLEGEQLLTVKSSWDEIEKAVNRYIDSVERSAKISFFASQQAALQQDLDTLAKQIDSFVPGFWTKFWDKLIVFSKTKQNSGKNTFADWLMGQLLSGQNLGIENLVKEMKAKTQMLDEVNAHLETLKREALENAKELGGGNGGSGSLNEKDPFLKIVNTYLEAIKELNNQKLNGMFEGAEAAEDYNDALEKIVRTAGEAIFGFADFNAEAKRLGPTYVKATQEIEKYYREILKKDNYKKAIDALKDYEKTNTELLNQQANAQKQGIDVGDKYQQALDENVLSTYEAVAALGDVTSLMDIIPEEMRKTLNEVINNVGAATDRLKSQKASMQTADDKYNKKFQNPVAFERDARYDFSKKLSDILEDVYQSYDKVQKDLESRINYIESNFDTSAEDVKNKLEALNAALQDCLETAEDFAELAQLAKFQEVVKDLEHTYGQTVYAGIKDAAMSLDRLTSSYRSFQDAVESFKSGDSSFIDVLTAGINSFFQNMDMVIGLLENYQKITEMQAQLSQVYSNTELMNLSSELGLREAINQSILRKKELLGEATVAELGEAAAAKLAAQNAAKEAIAGATASGSKQPFPANLLAISAGVAAVISALSMLPKFAEGGIVGGNSKKGDKVLARLNSNEGVLTEQGVKNLHTLYNNRTLGGQVQFKIKGSDLVGAIKNYESQVRG